MSESKSPRSEQDAAPRSVLRLLGIFETLSNAEEGLALAELSTMLTVPKSSLLMLLRPLTAHGYLTHGAGRYRLGPKIFQLAADIVSIRRFPNVLRPFMEDLAARTNETVLLMTMDHELRSATFIEVIDSSQVVRYAVRPGTRLPLYASSGGKLFLAYENVEWREDYIRATKLKGLTPYTITDKTELRRQLDVIRKTGIATSAGESVLEAAGISAPIFDSDGKVIAALVVGAPTDRFERVRGLLEPHLIEVASLASAAMGYRANAGLTTPPGVLDFRSTSASVKTYI